MFSQDFQVIYRKNRVKSTLADSQGCLGKVPERPHDCRNLNTCEFLRKLRVFLENLQQKSRSLAQTGQKAAFSRGFQGKSAVFRRRRAR